MKRIALIIAIIIAIITPLSPATACDGPNCDVITGGANGNVDTSQWMNMSKESLADGMKFMNNDGQKIMGQGHGNRDMTVAGSGELNQARWINSEAATPNAKVWHVDTSEMSLKASAETGVRCPEFKIEAEANRSATTETHAGETSMSAKTEHDANLTFKVEGANPSVAPSVAASLTGQTGYLQESTKFPGYQTGTSQITIKGTRDSQP